MQNATDMMHRHFLFQTKVSFLFCLVNVIQTVN